jgi:hypothetical protein
MTSVLYLVMNLAFWFDAKSLTDILTPDSKGSYNKDSKARVVYLFDHKHHSLYFNDIFHNIFQISSLFCSFWQEQVQILP